jgi:hypothetical protein
MLRAIMVFISTGILALCFASAAITFIFYFIGG